MKIVVKTCINLTKNVYVCMDWESPNPSNLVGNYKKSEFVDVVEDLTDKYSDYEVIINGETVSW